MYTLKKASVVKVAISMAKLRQISNKVNKVRGNLLIDDTFTSSVLAGKKRSKTLQNQGYNNFGPMTDISGKNIYVAGDVSSNKALKASGKVPSVKLNKSKEMINRAVILHESDEVKAIARRKINKENVAAKVVGGHASADVIMRESNLVRSLPPNNGEVRKFFKPLREADSSLAQIQSVMPNFEYGKTRLSRHARKNILKMLEPK